jgi:cyanophycin synthetase
MRGPWQQPSREITLGFEAPSPLHPGAIDSWLEILNPALAGEIGPRAPSDADARLPGLCAWLERGLLLARELLQLAAIPALDRPRLISCVPEPTQPPTWRATVAVPVIDPIPARAYQIAFQAALRSTAWMMQQQPTTAAREQLYDQLARLIIAPLQRLGAGGRSTMPLLRAAHARGIPFQGLGGGLYQLGLGAKGRLMDRSSTDRDAALGGKLAQSKPLTAQLLRQAGLPAPTHRVVTSLSDARAAAERFGWPVIIKPPDLDRGEGVSEAVDPASLEQGFATAQRLSRSAQVVVERKVDGVCHRLFVMSGRLLYAVKRHPMGLHGDGVRSIEALVAAACAAEALRPPWSRSPLRPIDALARAAITAAGLAPHSIPRAGQFVPLRPIESTAWGGVDEDVTTHVHPDNLLIALDTAALFRLDVAGIDIITPDIAQPWHRNGAIINEVNFAPLLGGADVSRRAIPAFLDRLLDGDGRIPLEAFLGGDEAWTAACARRSSLGGDAAGVFVTSAVRTLTGNGQEIVMPFRGLYPRSRALLLSRHVQALLLVVQDDEFLESGLSIGRIDRLIDTGGTLRDHRQPARILPAERAARLRRRLSDHAAARPS